MAASVSLLAIVTLIFSGTLVPIDAAKDGFTVELINRDSPKSPFYNPRETPTQRIVSAVRRSMSRVHHFSPTKNSDIFTDTAQSEMISNQGEYLMKFSLGTPAFDILAIADTGSDLIWTQCKPCDQCYEQDAPLFDPKSSSTYRDISCSTKQCDLLKEGASCSGEGNKTCHYSYSYGDRSFTSGNVAADTITLGSTSGRPVLLPKAIIGCGHNNGGSFTEKGSGIVGLGGGPISLISQLGSTIDGKFSYCLVPLSSNATNSSKLNFGSNGIVSGGGVQSTPLISKDPDTFYFLTLEAVSVGSERIKFPGSSFGTSEGNIIIDSGTTLTLFPEDFFSELSSAVQDAVAGTPVEDPSGILSLCYSIDADLKFPSITAHFDGADVKLNPLNTFVQVSDTVLCFAFNPINSGAIFGNLAQMNFLVGYDLEGKTVSFKPTDCTQD
ncbi:Aspartic proteinase nepenthesin-1 precursor, putative [Ricinus communis]|uniref:Aspartic proteinase nepenthesin-1, putative n=1 Tax=Ricinus communis TaxID=3988 RepID=B9SDC4_RICCO|nr:Aspartic proteinase nepenthesin-1 precursor, putative [Ricinus communis]|eukprot:XP_002523993.1 aspartic proteinase CDR1 [Ricinus communis]